ncbi:MAG: hypothetical protein IKJ59_08685 [Clostridia bacterium]|nr:hypothetical protein [Clostridia bacterium]
MRFFSFLLVVLMISTNVVSAQTNEEMQASQKRYEKLAKMCKKEPKKTGIKDVDVYVAAVYTSAIAAVATTEQLQGLYYRQIGQTQDGVTDVTVKKPTVNELTELSATIATQALAITAAAKSAESAVKTSTEQKNPMVAAKIAKALAFTKDAYPVIVEESAFQTKAIAEMIETAKSSENL